MKMPNAIANTLFAICGMDCMVCYRHCDAKNACPGCLPQTYGESRWQQQRRYAF